MKKKIQGLADARFEVCDTHGRLLLQVYGILWTREKKRVMCDPAGYPILTMHEKPLIWCHRWTVLLGDGSIPSNVLFSVQRSHSLRLKTQLDVFLPPNFSENICNFHVTGRCSSESCKVYKGDRIIAEINHKLTLDSTFEGKRTSLSESI